MTYGLQETTAPWQAELWFPEYAVTPDGKPDATGAFVGWLGYPLAAPLKLASGLYVRSFQRGLVLLNPTASIVTCDFLYPRWKRIGSTIPERVVSVGPADALLLWGE